MWEFINSNIVGLILSGVCTLFFFISKGFFNSFFKNITDKMTSHNDKLDKFIQDHKTESDKLIEKLNNLHIFSKEIKFKTESSQQDILRIEDNVKEVRKLALSNSDRINKHTHDIMSNTNNISGVLDIVKKNAEDIEKIKEKIK